MKNNVRNPRKIFSILIGEKEYDVYDIEGKEHEGMNGEPKTWWLYFSDKLPEGLVPPSDSDRWEPYSKGALRRVWEINIKQSNSTKEKWNSTRFNNHIWVSMKCNGKVVYEFGTNGESLDFAMAKVQYLQVMMQEHPYNFFEPEQENGRKICWYGLPATVKVKSSTWEIGIVPDYTAGLTKEEWWLEYENRTSRHSAPDQEHDDMEKEDFEESKSDDFINWGDALSDQHIYWFRK